MKKKIIIISLIALMLIFGILWYVFIYRNYAEKAQIESKIEEVADFIDVRFLGENIENNLFKYVFKDYKQILEYNFDTNESRAIYTLDSGLIEDTIWSHDSKQVIARIYDNSKYLLQYINLETGQSANLNSNIQKVVFSPDGKQIAYWFFKSNQNTINIANPDGTNWKVVYNVEDLGESNILLYWLNNGLYYFVQSSTEITPSELYKLDLKNKNKPEEILSDFFILYPGSSNRNLVSQSSGFGIYDTGNNQFSEITQNIYGISAYTYLNNEYMLVAGSPSQTKLSNSIYLINLKRNSAEIILDGSKFKKFAERNILNLLYNKKTNKIYINIDNTIYNIDIDVSKYIK
ncbi:MAG: hypothetical protein ABH837_03340 [bacterium]